MIIEIDVIFEGMSEAERETMLEYLLHERWGADIEYIEGIIHAPEGG